MTVDERWPDEYQPDWDTLESAKSEDVFGEAAFELFKETAILTSIAACIIPTHPLTRDEAILGGLLVKASKLGKAIMAITAHLGADRQLALFRELLEALASLWYLLDDPQDESRFEAYVLNSLVAERALIKVVEQNIAERGVELPIEASMKRSVRNTAAAAGLEVASATRSRWPKAEELISSLGQDAYLAYRTGSSVVHSQWADLIRNHLIRSGEAHFELRYEELPPKPQPLYAGATLIALVLDQYMTKTRLEVAEPFRTQLSSLSRRLERIAQMHGEWDDARRR